MTGLATGGNVSAAMSLAGERATYETFITFTNQLVLLGKNTFHVLMIRTWNERIDYLVKANNFLDCINLGTDFYNDQGKALVGLKGEEITVCLECSSFFFRCSNHRDFKPCISYTNTFSMSGSVVIFHVLEFCSWACHIHN